MDRPSSKLNVSGFPPDLKRRLLVAAHDAGVPMNRYVIDVLEAHVPQLRGTDD